MPLPYRHFLILLEIIPHLHLAPPLGMTRLSFAEIFGVRKLDSLGYRVELFA